MRGVGDASPAMRSVWTSVSQSRRKVSLRQHAGAPAPLPTTPKARLMIRTTRFALGLLAAGAFALTAPAANAALIEIEFTGLNIAYDGSSITDANVVGSDPLTSASITVDGVAEPGSPFSTDVSLDLDIPGVGAIPLTFLMVAQVWATGNRLARPARR